MDYLDIKQLANKLGVCTRTVERMVNSGKMPPPRHFGKLRRWTASTIDNFAGPHDYITLPDRGGATAYRLVLARKRISYIDGTFGAAFQTLDGEWHEAPWKQMELSIIENLEGEEGYICLSCRDTDVETISHLEFIHRKMRGTL